MINTTAERAKLAALEGRTPGPWGRIVYSDCGGYHIGTGGWESIKSNPDGGGFLGYHICQTTGYYKAADADAHLIAAAPDMKAALATALDEIDRLRRLIFDDIGPAIETYIGPRVIGYPRVELDDAIRLIRDLLGTIASARAHLSDESAT